MIHEIAYFGRGDALLKARLLIVSLLVVGGCGDVSIFPGVNRPIDSDPTSGSVVTVRFRNLTRTEAVSVQFYLAAEPLQNLPNDLFTEPHQVTASIGLAGTGIIQPIHEDVREFPCSTTLSIGTSGGEFLDAETGEPRGSGERRWLQHGPLKLCGSMVTFVYAGSVGQFTTAVEIED